MSIYQNRQGSFFHTNRHAELIFTGDNDAVMFWSDITPFETTAGIQLTRDAAGIQTLYAASPEEAIDFSERVLLWARMNGDEIVGGMRWVPYVVDNDALTQEIKPLREVFAPRVEYDKQSNNLVLTFWTNVNSDYTGTVYDETELYPVLSEDFAEAIANEEPLKAKRVMCYATGSFFKGYTQGGFLLGPQGNYITSAENMTGVRWDLVPVFNRPRIVNWAQTVDNLGGLAVDGWYGVTGTGDPTGVTGTFEIVTSVEYSEITGIMTRYYREFEFANGILVNVGDTGSTSVFEAVTCEPP